MSFPLIVQFLIPFLFLPSPGPPLYSFKDEEIQSIVVKLEYLKDKIPDYVKHGGIIPSTRTSIDVVFQNFRENGSIGGDFSDYVYRNMVKQANRPYLYLPEQASSDDVMDKLRQHLINSTKVQGIKSTPLTEKEFLEQFEDIEYCVFGKNKADLSDDSIYIGVYSAIIVKTQGYQEYLRAIAATREGHYFQDFEATPYESGTFLVTRVEAINVNEFF
jgi:hypothetical protein